MPVPGFLRRRDRPRVLYVIQAREYSGAEVFAAPVMRADADPLLACPPASGTAELAARLGVPAVALPFRPLRVAQAARSVARGLATVRDLRRVLRAHPERELVYATSLRPGMLAALAGAGLRRRALWVVTDRLPPPPLRQAVRLLARLGCRRAAATSRWIADDFAGRSRTLRARTTVVYPGVDASRFSPARPGAPRAAIVGAVSPTKRTDLAVEVAALVAAQEPGFVLDVVGRAQYRDEDMALERELRARAGESVRFAGHTPDVAAALAGAGLLLHCRPDEPFGVVLIEAMAAGLPVVAPAAGGPREIVEDGVTGLLYPPGDAGAAAAQVLRLLRDPEEARRMGRAGRARARERFSEAEQVDRFEALLAELSADGAAMTAGAP